MSSSVHPLLAPLPNPLRDPPPCPLDTSPAAGTPTSPQLALLDLRSLGALATMHAPAVLTIANTLVQNLCARTTSIIPDRNLLSVRSAHYWPFTGTVDGAVVVHVINTTTLVSLHELSTLLYWTSLGALAPTFPLPTSAAYSDARKLGLVSGTLAHVSSINAYKLPTTPEPTLQMGLHSALSTDGRVQFSDSTLTSTLPVVAGFVAAYQDCTTGLPVRFSLLSLNTTIAPVYYGGMGGGGCATGSCFQLIERVLVTLLRHDHRHYFHALMNAPHVLVAGNV